MPKKLDEPPQPIGCRSHFLDSGSFTLWTEANKWAKEHGKSVWDFYETPEHWDYMDAYVAFIKQYAQGIDLYANVDVIPNPELTWRNQQYLESKGLTPVPVVHFKTHLKWLQHYIDNGYDLIALGGLVGSTSQDGCRAWIDRCFEMVCDGPKRLPKVKVHGFGVTSFPLLFRYPWYSVDSTTWIQIGAYGAILLPRLRNGQFVFDKQPFIVGISKDSPSRKVIHRHYSNMRQEEQKVVRRWLDQCGLPLGKNNPDGTVKEEGAINHHACRKAANIHFFENMCQALPEYPWSFHGDGHRANFGLR